MPAAPSPPPAHAADQCARSPRAALTRAALREDRLRSLRVPADAAPCRPRCRVEDRSHTLTPYEVAWRRQREAVREVSRAGVDGRPRSSGTVLLYQHPPVYTLGAGSSTDFLKFDPARPPFPLHQTERGGEVTYHGPGQLVVYPVLNLKHFVQDLHWYLRSLERVVIRALEEVSSICARQVEGLTGVWVGDHKVAAIGVRASRWITYHGLALNVATELSPFQAIVPCGIADRGVTSVREVLAAQAQCCKPALGLRGAAPGASVSSVDGGGEHEDDILMKEYAVAVLDAFSQVFDVDVVEDLQ